MRHTALITGASGGLGLELARIFAREGYDLVLTARSGDKLLRLKRELEAAYGGTAEVFPCDLAEPGAAREIFAFTEARGIGVEVLVNNAGFGDFGEFAVCDERKQQEMVQVNVAALMLLTRLYLPEMKRRGEGRILNLASVASFQPGPLMSVYYASKAFVLSFSEALAVELRGSGITVTALCPGPTRTGFAARAGWENSRMFQGGMAAAQVAEYGYKAMTRGKVVAIPGAGYRLLIAGSRLLPRAALRNIIYRIQRERTP